MTKYRISDEQGLIHAYFQRLPGQETDPLYLSIQDQITQNRPQTMIFGFTRLPIVGELLRVERFLWQVRQVVHHEVQTEVPDNLFADDYKQMATLHICFYGAIG